MSTTRSNSIVWCNGNVFDFKDTLNSLTGIYEYVYVSLGGKFNEPTVAFSNPAYLAKHDFPSNSQYQMFPMFVRFPKKRGKHIVIIVDSFADTENREFNQKLVERATAQFPHIDVLLYDTTLHIKNVRPFTEYIVDWLNVQGISPDKCIIANYIRFRGCTSLDYAQLEIAIPQTVQCVLNESKTYTGCLYQWFGCQYYTYNLLYSYLKYDMSRHLKVILLFHECAEATQVVSGNVSNLFMFEIAREKANKSVLIEFMKHTLDITSYSKTSDTIYSKMVEFCSREILE